MGFAKGIRSALSFVGEGILLLLERIDWSFLRLVQFQELGCGIFIKKQAGHVTCLCIN